MSIVLQDLRGGISRVLIAAALSLASGWFGDVHAQPADLKAAAAAIMQADRDFNQAVAARDRAKFLALISEHAVFVGEGPMRGHAEILKGWAPFFDPAGPTLSWEPTRAEVLVGGDVGVTIGSWIRRAKSPDGRTTETRGQYATTWQKQKDGAWKVVYDIGSTAP
jgi:uncharacterized protein (TIGR02246 family)